MATDIARLGIAVDTTDLKKGEAGLKNLAATGQRAEGELKDVEAQAKRTGGAVYGMGRNANAASRVMGTMGGGLRNVGLQLNQVAQQGAITGNYFQAFTFQLPDILLGFGGIGIAAGIAAGALAPFIENMFAASERAKMLEDGLEGVREATRAYIEANRLATASIDTLRDRFGEAAGDMRSTLLILEEIAKSEAQKAIDALSASLAQLLGTAGDGDARAELAKFFDVNIFLAFTDAGREARKEARALTAEFVAAQEALAAGQGNIDAQTAATQRMLAAAISLADASGDRNSEEETLIKLIAESLKQMQAQRGTQESIEDALRRTNARAQQAARYYAQTRMEAEGLLQATAAQISLENRRDAAANTGSGRLDPRIANRQGYGEFGRETIDEIIARFEEQQKRLNRTIGGTKRVVEEVARELSDFEQIGVSSVQSVAQAWGDWIVNGFNDFKSFAGNVLTTFKQMIARMIATAAANKILLGIGLGGTSATAAVAGTAGSTLLGGALGTFGSSTVAGTGLLGGLGATASAVGSGGLGGLFSIGANAAAAGGGIAATIGAALPVIGIVAGLFSLFRRNRKPPITAKDFQAIQQGLLLTGQQLFDTGNAGQKAAADLKKIAGGIDDFQEKTSRYYDLFFTEEEKRQKAEEGIAATFAKFNLEAATTKEEFRALVEGLDLTTKNGRKAYDALLTIAPTFAALTDEAQDLGNALDRLTGRQGLFATLQDQVFVGSQLAQGNPLAFTSLSARLDMMVEAIRAGNIVIARNTKDTADLLLRQELTPA